MNSLSLEVKIHLNVKDSVPADHYKVDASYSETTRQVGVPDLGTFSSLVVKAYLSLCDHIGTTDPDEALIHAIDKALRNYREVDYRLIHEKGNVTE